MPIIGTAGHVDHGKSTLIEALTGRDPDRWAEEKERGLTIDLGFAWTDLDGIEVSFVDVPGHERFMKNMLAGIESIDVALLVVAADEGWMPQTEEHLAVLDLLDITACVVAVTKTDRVDQDLAELAQLEITERLAGTCLESAPTVPVSALTGAGLDELRQHLRRLSEEAQARRARGSVAMWIDRSFSIDGAGTVVTGTLLDDHLSVGDEVHIWPGDHEVRIRGLHSHERSESTVEPGRRTAANLVGIDRGQVKRGALLTASPWPTSTTFSAGVRTARYADDLSERGAYHLHMGSGSWPVEVRPLGESHGLTAVLIRSETALPVRVGERFILRETGRQSVVAGGQVIDPAARRRTVEAQTDLDTLAGILTSTPDEAADVLLEARGTSTADELAGWSRGGVARNGIQAGASLVSAARASQMASQAVEIVASFHADHPLREGVPVASLASQLGSDIDLTRAVLDGEPSLRDDGATMALSSFNAGLTDAQERILSDTTAALLANGFSVPRLSELGLDRELLHVALREERLVRVTDDLVFLPQQIEAMHQKMKNLPDPFGVGDFKDSLEISRKYAVPLLEFFDAKAITRRSGNERTLRKP